MLAGQPEARVTAIVSDKISRGFLLDGVPRELALDFNARLVTELRVLEIWPARYRDRCAS